MHDTLKVKEQLALFGLPKGGNDTIIKKTRDIWLRKQNSKDSTADYGTFKDSLRAPVHRWFRYPAGYSYRLVEEKINQYGLNGNNWVLDPFVGSGTTSVECKRYRVNSIGIEAHPFVGWIAQKKLNWNLDLNAIVRTHSELSEIAKSNIKSIKTDGIPELVHKCYSSRNLKKLLAIRNSINSLKVKSEIADFFRLALIDTLRNASKAATGWPYIGPTKFHEKSTEKEAFKEFRGQVRKMYEDLEFIQTHFNSKNTNSIIIVGDSREKQQLIESESIDLALTSPPYLNNYDYADRTRLETYFLGWYKSWGEITEKVRDKLIVSATTQIRRSEFRENYGLNPFLKEAAEDIYNILVDKINLLSESRLHKGGKKSYDCLVSGYFSDMFRVLQQVYFSLKPGSDFIMVLGDSAPYGVYIPTHEYLGRLGLAIGFSNMRFEELRTRGGKWKNNPQRHKVKLKEVILTLTK